MFINKTRLTDAEQSLRWRWLSVMAMGSVVLIHAGAGDRSELAAWSVILQNLFTKELVAWAVPFFFIQSGYWACRTYCIGSRGYSSMIASKAKSLLMPYFLWSIYGGIAFLPLVCFTNLVAHRALFERTFLGASTLLGCLDRLFGVTYFSPIGMGPLWYVRMLLLIFLTLPLWIFLARQSKKIILILGCCILGLIPDLYIVYTPYALRLASLGYFLIGMWAALSDGAGLCLTRTASSIALVIWVGLAILFACVDSGCVMSMAFLKHGYPLFCLLGIVVFTGMYDNWGGGGGWNIPSALYNTFWIYCLHHSIALYVKIAIVHCIGETNCVTLVATLISFSIALGVSAVLGVLCRRYFPRAYAILVGGR